MRYHTMLIKTFQDKSTKPQNKFSFIDIWKVTKIKILNKKIMKTGTSQNNILYALQITGILKILKYELKIS